MSSNLPSRIDRAAIERVIQRATELQTGERDLSDGMSSDEVIALGKDVGIPERYLRQALLEEQSKADFPLAGGWLDGAAGPGTVTAQRVVQEEPAVVEQRLLRWIGEHELLTVQRQQPGRITWEPLRGVSAAIRRSTGALKGDRPFMLGRAALVSATITGLEPGFCHVTLAADVTGSRAGSLAGAATMGGLAVTAGIVLSIMSPFAIVAVAPAPFLLAAAWAILRQHRRVAARVQLGLERALDNLERGEVKPTHALGPGGSALDAVLEGVRRALRP